MPNVAIISVLNEVLANTYALYLKTQNSHWHVKGPSFYALHNLFEEQYLALAGAVDQIAERIVTLNGTAVASFQGFQALSQIEEGIGNDPKSILEALAQGHSQLVAIAKKALGENPDRGTEDLLSARIGEHEKMRWMLLASI